MVQRTLATRANYSESDALTNNWVSSLCFMHLEGYLAGSAEKIWYLSMLE